MKQFATTNLISLCAIAISITSFGSVLYFTFQPTGGETLTAEIRCQAAGPNCVRIREPEIFQGVALQPAGKSLTIQNITGADDGLDPGSICYVTMAADGKIIVPDGASLGTPVDSSAGASISAGQMSIVLFRGATYERFKVRGDEIAPGVKVACDKPGPSLTVVDR